MILKVLKLHYSFPYIFLVPPFDDLMRTSLKLLNEDILAFSSLNNVIQWRGLELLSLGKFG